MKKIFTIIGTAAIISGVASGLAACGSNPNKETEPSSVILETGETIVEETTSHEGTYATDEGVPANMEGSDY